MKGDLSKSDYLCMNQSGHKEDESEPPKTGSVRKSSASTAVPERKATPHSMRSRRTATWARPHSSDDGYSRQINSLSLSIFFYFTYEYLGVLIRSIPFFFHTHSDSVLKSASLDLKKLGQRIFVFIIGGATRSEVHINKQI